MRERERDSLDEVRDGIDEGIDTAGQGVDLYNRLRRQNGRRGKDGDAGKRHSDSGAEEGARPGDTPEAGGVGQPEDGSRRKPRGEDPHAPKPKDLDIRGGAAQQNLSHAKNAPPATASAAGSSATTAGAGASSGATAGGITGSGAAAAAASSSAGAGATTAGTAAGSAAGGAGGATAGAAAGTAVTPGVGTAIGALAGAVAAPAVVQVIKIIVKLIIIVVVFTSLLTSYFKSIPGMIFDSSTLLVDQAELLEAYENQRGYLNDKHVEEYGVTAQAADEEAEERAEAYEDDYDSVTYSVVFSHTAEQLAAIFGDSINFILALYDTQNDDWSTGNIEEFMASQQWENLWSGFIVYKFDDDKEEHEVTREEDGEYLHITFYVDIYDLGFPHIVDAFDADDEAVTRATEMAANASDLFGTGFALWDGGGAFGDADYAGTVSGGSTHSMILAAIDKLEEDFSCTGSPLFPLPSVSPVITSYYGPRNYKPDPYHTGIDFSAASGTPIVSSMDGIVLLVRNTHPKAFGKHIVIYHGGGISTMYAHMSRFAGLSPGDRVTRGQVIGYVGKTGLSTGNHLHYEYQVDGQPKNPLHYLDITI